MITDNYLDQRMREFQYWKESRDTLVKEALSAGMPIEHIALTMGISKSVIYRIQDHGSGKHTDMSSRELTSNGTRT